MVGLTSLNGPIWPFLEDHVYKLPPYPARKRTKPMEVICVGLPRSATESLQQALLKLGYDHTYHGWDLLFDRPSPSPEWSKLARRKFCPTNNIDGDCEITAEDFDRIIGHCMAITDAPACVFASELIKAYRDAKVILNVRRDLEKWRQSAINNLVRVQNSWFLYWMSFAGREMFWMWHVYTRLLWPGLFRCTDGSAAEGIVKNGKWVYREHCDMIRGMVPKERLLEWGVEDGWEPLCRFLGKEVPNEPFPRTNDAAGFKAKETEITKTWILACVTNTLIFFGLVALIVAVIWKLI